ncbi:recombinase family protein [Sphingobium yanoikuyae]|uniref:recombinase family protein n=1 Tax=Sphingobium yanoikuyae TaxID=13690 RepID=UPI002E282F77|nr:recombinase family protein [Sphingobium yanoikuyae]
MTDNHEPCAKKNLQHFQGLCSAQKLANLRLSTKYKKLHIWLTAIPTPIRTKRLYHKGPIMKLGYARVSTGEQNLALQIDALRAAGAEAIFEDKGISGSMVLKPAYGDMLRQVRAGDEIMVWRLDRLGRSLPALIGELELLAGLDVGFRSLTEQIETVTPAGRLFFHMVGAFAQFERDVIRERTNAGLQSARRAGKKLGRPALIGDEQWTQAKTLMAEPTNMGAAAVAKLLGVSRQAIYKRLDKDKAAQGGELAALPSPPRQTERAKKAA